MKRILSMFALLLLAGCEQSAIEEQSCPNVDVTKFYGVIPDTDTRTYVDENVRLRWHAGDQLTLFVGTTLNKKFQFDGETGDNAGYFSDISTPAFGAGNTVDRHYAVYPYDSTIKLSEDGELTVNFPTEQIYAEKSFGQGANIMVAATADTNDYDLMFSNVGSYLRVRLWGEFQTVKSISVTAIGGESIAGKATVVPEFGGDPTCTMTGSDSAVTLHCGEAVSISASSDAPTEFWVVLPPVTLASGFRVTVANENGGTQTYEVAKSFTFARNTYYSLTRELTIAPQIPNNEVWYTTSDESLLGVDYDIAWGANVVSNTYENGKGILSFSADISLLADGAFSGESKMTSVVLPETVVELPESVFAKCSSLTKVILPNTLTSIGSLAFYECRALPAIEIPDNVETIWSGAFSNCSNLKSIKIPAKVTRIEEDTFEGCATLADVQFHDGVSYIGDYAFTGCRKLEKIVLPPLLTHLSEGLFWSCVQLKEVSIPDGVTMIDRGAFYNCDILPNITIPENVTSIGESAFGLCHHLINITLPENLTSLGKAAFYDCFDLPYVNIPQGIKSIGDKTFHDCRQLNDIVLPDSLQSIGNQAFALCANLSQINIPNTVISIGELAFSGCENLQEVIIPESVSSLGQGAFASCIALKTAEINANITSCAASVFKGCTSLREVSLPETLEVIGGAAFQRCDSLTKVNIPNNVTVIGDSAFADCYSLPSIVLPEGLVSVNDYCFSGCANLVDVTLPSTISSICRGAFLGCAMTTISIPKNVTVIQYYAFKDCTSLSEIYCSPTTPPVGDFDMFVGVSANAKIFVPIESVDTYKSAEEWCDYADMIVDYDFGE
ncbi:MAG: leucine-rich repeat domain-containing protein [Rikenellaceae bacterium]|nr:leucine-rich repeat domain-containing protein [Rikenellaceae bacterium]